MKKISSIIIAFLMITSMLLPANAAALEAPKETTAAAQQAAPELNTETPEEITAAAQQPTPELNTETTIEDEFSDKGRGNIPLTQQDLQELSVIESVDEYYSILAQEQQEEGSSISAFSTPFSLPLNQNSITSVDNSKSVYFPSVGDQGSLGSCVAWSNIYYQMSYEQNKALRRTATAENSMSPIWIYNLCNGGRDDGLNAAKANGAAKTIGVATRRTSPDTSTYLNWTNSKDAWKEAQRYRIDKSYLLSVWSEGDTHITGPSDSDLSVVKSALRNGEVLTFSTYIYGWVYNRIEKNSQVSENDQYLDEFIVPYSTSRGGPHRMTIVGYNDEIWTDINSNGIVEEGEKGAFKIANSWGEDYKNDGFVWMSYDMLNRVSSVDTDELSSVRYNGGCNDFMSEIFRINIMPVENIANIHVEFTLTSKLRSNLDVKLVAKKDTTEEYEHLSPLGGMHSPSSREKYSFDGTQSESTYTFSFDLSKVISDINSETLSDYIWSVEFTDEENDESILKVKDVKITDYNIDTTYNSNLTKTVSLNGSSATVNFDIQPLAVSNEFKVKNFSTNAVDGKVHFNQDLVMTANAANGTAPYQYMFTYIQNGIEATAQYQEENTATFNFETPQTFRPVVKIKDATGTVVTKTLSEITVKNDLVITSVNTDLPSPQPLGNRIKISTITDSAFNDTYTLSFTHKFYCNETLVHTYITRSSSIWWEPTRAGNYRIETTVKDPLGNTSTKTTEYVITNGKNTTTTIYYKGFGSPTIHYQLGDGNWTQDTMHITGELPSYNHKYVLDFGANAYANIYFSDSDGNKDNNNGLNYSIFSEFSQYIYANGKFTPVNITSSPLAIDSFTTSLTGNTMNVARTLQLNARASGGVAPYSCQFGYINEDGNTILKQAQKSYDLYESYDILTNYVFYQGKIIKPIVIIKDAIGNTVTKNLDAITVNGLKITQFTTDFDSPQDVGAELTLSYAAENVQHEAEAVFEISKEGKIVSTSTADQYGIAKWTPTEGGNYTITLKIKDRQNQIAEQSINYQINEGSLKVMYFDSEYGPINDTLSVGDYIYMTAKGSGGTPPYEYQFGYIQNGETTLYNYNTWNTTTFIPYCEGTFIPIVNIKDAEGNIASTQYSEITIINGLKITNVIAAPDSPQTVGTQVNLSAEYINAFFYKYYSGTFEYKIEKEGETIETFNTETAVWTPTEPGIYTITFSMTDYYNQFASKSIQYAVKEDNTNTLTVYYKGYTNPNMHYKVGDGEWTDVPGVAMVATTEKEGYTHKLTVDMGTAAIVTACFNDGYGNWDSRNGENYTFGTRIYTYSNGVVTKADNTLTVYYKGFANPNMHYKVGDGNWTEVPGIAMVATTEKEGYTHKLTVDMGTATSVTACFNDGRGNWDSRNGENYTFGTGIYTYSNGVVTKVGNTLTVYYKGFANPNMHYKVGDGNWTEVPGVAMIPTTEKEGYTHKLVINMDTATSVTACFNDGYGNWDSKYGENYTFGVGTYTYSNGVVTKIY